MAVNVSLSHIFLNLLLITLGWPLVPQSSSQLIIIGGCSPIFRLTHADGVPKGRQNQPITIKINKPQLTRTATTMCSGAGSRLRKQPLQPLTGRSYHGSKLKLLSETIISMNNKTTYILIICSKLSFLLNLLSAMSFSCQAFWPTSSTVLSNSDFLLLS